MLLSKCIAAWEANRAVGGLGPCGGFTLVGCQMPTLLLSHHPLPQPEKVRDEKPHGSRGGQADRSPVAVAGKTGSTWGKRDLLILQPHLNPP